MTDTQLIIVTIVLIGTILHGVYILDRKKRVGKISISMTRKGRVLLKKIGVYRSISLKKGGFDNIDECFEFIKENNL